jgi:hypothetical protein
MKAYAIAAETIKDQGATLDPKKAQEIAESILQVGLQSSTWCGRTANVSSWWRGCIVWRHASNWARKPSSDTSCRPTDINGPRLGCAMAQRVLLAPRIKFTPITLSRFHVCETEPR